jgi:multidrug resistance protein, MATE family
MCASFASTLYLPITLGRKGIELGTGLNSINMILELLIYLMIRKKSLKSWNGARLTQNCPREFNSVGKDNA